MRDKINKVKTMLDLGLITGINITSGINDVSYYSEIWSDPTLFSNLKLYMDAGNYAFNKTIDNSNLLQTIPLKPNIITNTQNIVSYPYITKIIQTNNINIINPADNIEEDVDTSTWIWKNNYNDIQLNICPVLDKYIGYYNDKDINRYYGKTLASTIPSNIIIISPLFTYFNNTTQTYSLVDEYNYCYNNLDISLEEILYIATNTHSSVFGKTTNTTSTSNTASTSNTLTNTTSNTSSTSTSNTSPTPTSNITSTSTYDFTEVLRTYMKNTSILPK
jgi:hypothetical protein